MKQINNPQNIKGFTLLEIMIALIIGLFLSAGVIKIFINTSASNRMQENLSRMQENARFAMKFITEDIQRANFFGGDCLRSAGSIKNHLDDSSGEYNPSLHSFRLVDTSGSMASIKNAINGTTGLSAMNSALDSPDSVTLRAFYSQSLNSLSAAMASKSALIETRPGSGFRDNDIVLITDCTFADIFQVTDASAAVNNQLKHEDGHEGAASSAIPGNSGTTDPVELQQAYPQRSFIYKLSNGSNSTMERTYSIGLSGPDNIPSLMRSSGGGGADALVGDIENMQFSYGVNNSTASPSVPSYYQSDITALTDAERENIVSIRVSILVRSPDDNLVTSGNGQAYTFNGGSVSGVSIPDRRLRKVYTSTVAVRNRPPIK